MKKNLAVFIAALVAVTLSASAGSVWKDADAESPILIKYTGTDTAPKILVNGLTLVLEESANTASNSFTIGTGTNVSTMLKLINSATGFSHTATAPVYPWKAIRWGSLLTDNLTNLLVTATNNAVTAGVWDKTVKWDTSAALHYDAVVSSLVGDSANPLAAEIEAVFGDALGTGTATVRVYENDTVKFQRVFGVTTNYHLFTVGGTSNTNLAINTVSEGNLPVNGLSFPGSIRIGAGKIGTVRVTHSGTATTGGIGASVK